MARELAATRRVRKGLLPRVAPGDGHAAPPDGAGARPVAANGDHVVGERVVADVRHEIGNYFHKLYYWADFLSESRVGRPGDVTATQMLEDTIRSLEELVRTTLEYVRPIGVSPIRMTAREVVDGIVRQLTDAADWRAETSGDHAVLGDRAVVVDPGRLSQLLGFIVRRLVALGTTALAMEVSVEDRASGEEVVALRATATATSCDPALTVLTEVEWATAENLARALGGELVHDGASGPTLVLALPLRA